MKQQILEIGATVFMGFWLALAFYVTIKDILKRERCQN